MKPTSWLVLLLLVGACDDKSSTATDETSEASVVRDRKAKPYGSGSLMARPASISRGDGGVTQIERELPVRLALAAAAGEFDVRKHKNGYRLATVPRESWLDQLGFVKGDVVRSINGVPIESIHSVDHAYTTDNSGFRVEIERDGETKTRVHHATDARRETAHRAATGDGIPRASGGARGRDRQGEGSPPGRFRAIGQAA